MEIDLLVDPVNERVALVDVERDRAFGPVFTGEDALALADLFITVAGDKLTPYAADVWDVALRAAQAMLAETPAPQDAPEPVSPPLEGVALDTGPVTPTAATSPELVPEVPEQPADDDRPNFEPTPITAAPVMSGGDVGSVVGVGRTSPPPGAEQCWNCHGAGTEQQAGETVACGICDGTGYIARVTS